MEGLAVNATPVGRGSRRKRSAVTHDQCGGCRRRLKRIAVIPPAAILVYLHSPVSGGDINAPVALDGSRHRDCRRRPRRWVHVACARDGVKRCRRRCCQSAAGAARRIKRSEASTAVARNRTKTITTDSGAARRVRRPVTKRTTKAAYGQPNQRPFERPDRPGGWGSAPPRSTSTTPRTGWRCVGGIHADGVGRWSDGGSEHPLYGAPAA